MSFVEIAIALNMVVTAAPETAFVLSAGAPPFCKSIYQELHSKWEYDMSVLVLSCEDSPRTVGFKCAVDEPDPASPQTRMQKAMRP